MAFIDKKDPVVLNIKLTSKGRELLSKGLLNFSYYALGDSEIDYNFNRDVQANSYSTSYTAFDSNILRPIDKNPNIVSFIPRNLSSDSYNYMSVVPTSAYNVENVVESLGFFTNSATTFITDTNHVKQPDAMVQISSISGGFNLTLNKSITYGANVNEPVIGDMLLIRWTHGVNTTGYAVNKNYPTPNLWYKIVNINTGTLATNDMNISVDRLLPDFSATGVASTVYAAAMVYYDLINFSGDTAFNMSPTEYLDESVLSFLQNSQCPTIVFPFWNMSIIYTEELAGVLTANLKFTQFKNKAFGGFVSYIQNQVPVNKKLGIIHYTNNSPANVYAEGFLSKTLRLEIPTIMWHKSTNSTLGATFVPSGTSYLLGGLNTRYYNLVDINNPSIIVGKVFNEMKIIIIEDQELLFAMSYKSNRNWTLPNYAIGS